VETYDVEVVGGVVIVDVVGCNLVADLDAGELEGYSRGDQDEGGHEGEKESDTLGHGEEMYVYSCSNLIDMRWV